MRKAQLFGRMLGMAVLLAFVSGGLGAQSLGEIARRVREEKAMAPKAKRVFTNDTLPKETTINTVGVSLPAPAAGDKGKPGDAKDDKGATGEEEKVWKAKFAGLRKTLAEEEKRLDLQQRELNLAQVQNYSDPNVAMREQFERTEIKKRDRKSTRLNSSHIQKSRMPSSA